MLWLSGIWPSFLSTTSSPILSHITFCLDGGSGPRWSHCLPAMAKASCTGLANSSFQIGHRPIPLKTLGDLTQKYLLALVTLTFSVKSLNQDVGYAKQVLRHCAKTQIHPLSLVYPSYYSPTCLCSVSCNTCEWKTKVTVQKVTGNVWRVLLYVGTLSSVLKIHAVPFLAERSQDWSQARLKHLASAPQELCDPGQLCLLMTQR